MRAMIKNVNIRGCAPKVNKKDEEYLLVRFEDETGESFELVDKDMSNQPKYKRNAEGDMIIDISIGKYTTIRVAEFTAYKQ